MPYIGMCLSKNHMWRGGSRRYGMEREAARWKAELATSVQMTLIANRVRSAHPPVHVEVGARFVDRGHSLDLQNIGEIVCDAVEEGTGVNDREYTFATTRPEFSDKALPEIRVTVTLDVEEEQA